MPDIVKQLGGIKALKNQSASPQSSLSSTVESPHTSSAPSISDQRTLGKRSEAFRTIHLRLSSEIITKLDLLKLGTTDSRTGIISQIVERYLASEEVEERISTIKKTIK